ncbi:MAG: PLP-dependent transferase [Flavobacteriales bacterium]|nr:PLP-dependent transferase [Flavobacteriales bacterium]MCB9197230.1 PLP-dependent transferase [Flavobacteriales bacterium]
MEQQKLNTFLQDVINNLPSDWLNLTTHRLDIYNESQAKFEFLDQFEDLYSKGKVTQEELSTLPTAYDYIRLGHPLSSVLEWSIAKMNHIDPSQVISFDSKIAPVLAILRKNLFLNKKTLITYSKELPELINIESFKNVYGYDFETLKVIKPIEIGDFNGSVIYISEQENLFTYSLEKKVDFFISTNSSFGSIIVVNGDHNMSYISEIQHVRRRETIAMTPQNCHSAFLQLFKQPLPNAINRTKYLIEVEAIVKEVTGVNTNPLICSSGLSTQYAIVMGLIDHALENHPGKAIKIVVPPNCYGGTNDQARRVAACIKNVEVMDLPVDGGSDMVKSIDTVLEEIAKEDAIAFIIAEIPTNPRVEVPDMIQLRDVLQKARFTSNRTTAIDPVFILDQTFCPNVHFLGDNELLASVRTIAYVSGSKFPSGGKCTAGYCTANTKAAGLMAKIEKHLQLCDNEATDLQLELLAEQMPSMLERIEKAYRNTREFVNYIHEVLPTAKINFVSEELAAQGFTPSVFSLDLPTKGNSPQERESYKRDLNLKLINMMIHEIPKESKYCVSYGQLKGCYWTIPATSTQGTTKEEDKDYIARVALSGNMDLEKHKAVFKAFVDTI